MEQNAAQAVTVRSVGVKYGLISAMISIVFFLVLVFTGQNAFDNTWNWIGLIFSIAILVLAQKNYKDSGDGFMSYGQGVGIAFWIALISLIIGGLFTYLYTTVIDTTVMDMMYQKQAEEMEKNGMTSEQIDMAAKWTRMLFWPIYIFFGLFFGVLVGVIVSIFTQKKRAEPTF
ncbi:MAG: DUF4199 domain-containing protein [Bacteroidota bacterium]